MNLAVRVDASAEIGTGHLVRCLALAHAMRSHGAKVCFVTRPLPSAVEAMLQAQGQPLINIGDCSPGSGDDVSRTHQAVSRFCPTGILDWLVVDHYGISASWERSARAFTRRIMVVDDLADRPHDCDVLLDQNFYLNNEHRYTGLLPEECVAALGPRFALLRPQFYERMVDVRVREGSIRRIFVSFGGSDPTNETAKALEALCRPEFSAIEVDVALGGANSRADDLVRMFGREQRIRLHRDPGNLATLMAQADVGIGGGGAMNWERCSMALPSIVVVIASNQAETSAALHRAGAILNLGWHAEVTADDIAAALSRLAADPGAVRGLSGKAAEIMAPEGALPDGIMIIDTLMRMAREPE